jgi:hypothetical protein
MTLINRDMDKGNLIAKLSSFCLLIDDDKLIRIVDLCKSPISLSSIMSNEIIELLYSSKNIDINSDDVIEFIQLLFSNGRHELVEINTCSCYVYNGSKLTCHNIETLRKCRHLPALMELLPLLGLLFDINKKQYQRDFIITKYYKDYIFKDINLDYKKTYCDVDNNYPVNTWLKYITFISSFEIGNLNAISKIVKLVMSVNAVFEYYYLLKNNHDLTKIKKMLTTLHSQLQVNYNQVKASPIFRIKYNELMNLCDLEYNLFEVWIDKLSVCLQTFD